MYNSVVPVCKHSTARKPSLFVFGLLLMLSMVLGSCELALSETPKIYGSQEFIQDTQKAFMIISSTDPILYNELFKNAFFEYSLPGDIAAAYNLPDRKIFIDYPKLYSAYYETDKVLAVVLAHEMYHITLNHDNMTYNQWEIITTEQTVVFAKQIKAPKNLIRGLENTLNNLLDN